MYLHLLTIVFVIAKIMNYIDWSWWLVFTPSILAVVLIISLLVLAAWASSPTNYHTKKYR